MTPQKKHHKMTWTIITICVFTILFAICCFLYFMIMRTIYPTDYEKYVTQYAQEYSVDESFIYAVIKTESDFDPEAESSAGAIGLMQLTPETFQWLQTKTGESLDTEALRDPETNIRYGVLLLHMNLESFDNHPEVALAAYHAGRTQARHWLKDPDLSPDGKQLESIPFDSTSDYVEKVLRRTELYQKLYE